MNWQIFIVGIAICAALFYIGLNVWKKIKSFSPKSSCGTGDCGCGTESKPRKSFIKSLKS